MSRTRVLWVIGIGCVLLLIQWWMWDLGELDVRSEPDAFARSASDGLDGEEELALQQRIVELQEQLQELDEWRAKADACGVETAKEVAEHGRVLSANHRMQLRIEQLEAQVRQLAEHLVEHEESQGKEDTLPMPSSSRTDEHVKFNGTQPLEGLACSTLLDPTVLPSVPLPALSSSHVADGVSVAHYLPLPLPERITLPRIHPLNNRLVNVTESFLWRKQSAIARQPASRFSSSYALLHFQDACITGRGGAKVSVWNANHVFRGHLCSGTVQIRDTAPCHQHRSLMYLEMPWSLSFQHFLADEVTRMAPVTELIEQDPHLKLVFEQGEAPLHLLSVLLHEPLQQSRERLVPFRLSSVYCATHLYLPLSTNPAFVAEMRPPLLVRMANQRFASADAVPADLIVLASRGGGSDTRPRHVLNEHEMLDVIRAWIERRGRKEELLVFEEAPHEIEEAMQVWRRARVVIGAHGGALANLFFTSGGSDVALIELCPSAEPSSSWWDVALGLQLSYWQILLPSSHSEPITVPVELLAHVLDDVADHLP